MSQDDEKAKKEQSNEKPEVDNRPIPRSPLTEMRDNWPTKDSNKEKDRGKDSAK